MSIKQISLEEAEAGMQIAVDLKDSNGTVLMPTGTSLTATSIKSLTRRGVESVSIIANDAPSIDQRLENERLKKRLGKLFRKSATGKLDRQLMDSVSLYRIGKKYDE
ncbi:hypothetical protein [Undibacterium terreum]|uniref:Uncharacterized protein n=1 Tax=Undibacterium terreum TaxID=1224302 RepID=A0A916UBN2_9BURK|nr:hypothetical protein [Undibacterium terreum]GGC65110.1 hypothetical protein GCM10011396_10120 [Undibacterium terreum]